MALSLEAEDRVAPVGARWEEDWRTLYSNLRADYQVTLKRYHQLMAIHFNAEKKYYEAKVARDEKTKQLEADIADLRESVGRLEMENAREKEKKKRWKNNAKQWEVEASTHKEEAPIIQANLEAGHTSRKNASHSTGDSKPDATAIQDMALEKGQQHNKNHPHDDITFPLPNLPKEESKSPVTNFAERLSATSGQTKQPEELRTAAEVILWQDSLRKFTQYLSGTREAFLDESRGDDKDQGSSVASLHSEIRTNPTIENNGQSEGQKDDGRHLSEAGRSTQSSGIKDVAQVSQRLDRQQASMKQAIGLDDDDDWKPDDAKSTEPSRSNSSLSTNRVEP